MYTGYALSLFVQMIKTRMNIFAHPRFLWAQLGLNQRPPDYESGATNQLSYRPGNYSDNFRIFAKRLQK